MEEHSMGIEIKNAPYRDETSTADQETLVLTPEGYTNLAVDKRMKVASRILEAYFDNQAAQNPASSANTRGLDVFLLSESDQAEVAPLKVVLDKGIIVQTLIGPRTKQSPAIEVWERQNAKPIGRVIIGAHNTSDSTRNANYHEAYFWNKSGVSTLYNAEAELSIQAIDTVASDLLLQGIAIDLGSIALEENAFM